MANELHLSYDRGVPLVIDPVDENTYRIIVKNFFRKVDHRYFMAITKTIGKLHIKIPKQSRKKWRKNK